MLKQTRTLMAASLVAGLAVLSPALAQDADAVLGTWATGDGNLVIHMYDAGNNYAARFVYGALVVEADGGTFKQDTQNPDPALQARSLAEVDFLSGLTWDAGDSRWENGQIYQAATGQTASARVTVDGDTLQLRAYRGTPMAGRTIVFQRRPD